MNSDGIRAPFLCIALAGIPLLSSCIAPKVAPVRSLPPALASYDVLFGRTGDTTVADIRARIPVVEGVLMMYPEGAEKFGSGWAHFVTKLEAKDTTGRPVELTPAGPAQWTVSGVDVVDLFYRVNMLHDREPGKWQFGVKEVAYVRPDFVFTTGKALFITNLEMPPALVRIHAPLRQRVLSTWSQIPGTTDQFRVAGPHELTESMIVVGSPVARTVRVGDTRINVVTSAHLHKGGAAVAAHVQRFLPAAAAVFGATPPDTLLIVAEVDSGYVGGGAAFHGGISLMFPEELGPRNRAEWGHVLDHEIVHLWIGYRLRAPDEAQEYWFSEGFTDYTTWMLEAANGLVVADTLAHVFRERFQDYRRQVSSVSMHAASAEKAKYYDLIYGGGLLVALALDVEIRARTDLKRGLPDVLRALYAEFGVGTNARYTAADVVRVVNDTCGCDLRSFFDAHVFGTEVLRIDDVLARLGFGPTESNPSARARSAPLAPTKAPLYSAWFAGWRSHAFQR